MKIINEHTEFQKQTASIFILHQGQKVRLSRRQQECLFFLLRGKTAKEIGRKLSISHRTVECHLEGLKVKLGCQNRREIIEQMFINPSLKQITI